MRIKKLRKKKWLPAGKIKSIKEIFNTRWIGVLHENGEYTIIPRWLAWWFPERRFMKHITSGNLYVMYKNPYLR